MTESLCFTRGLCTELSITKLSDNQLPIVQAEWVLNDIPEHSTNF